MRTAQADLKRHCTQTSESPFSHVSRQLWIHKTNFLQQWPESSFDKQKNWSVADSKSNFIKPKETRLRQFLRIFGGYGPKLSNSIRWLFRLSLVRFWRFGGIVNILVPDAFEPGKDRNQRAEIPEKRVGLID